MLRKTTFYILSLAALVALATFTQRGEVKLSGSALRANVAESVEVVDESVEFFLDYDDAVAKAQRENKPLLLFFMTDNCKYSADMLRQGFTDARVERLAKRFVCAKIDMNDPKNDDLCEEFDVVVSPTVQFLTARGAPLQRVSSMQNAERLSAQMQAALDSVAWRSARIDERALLR